MDNPTDSPPPEPAAPDAPLDPDPEIAALLGFAPVHRRTRRHDGWPPDKQRAFIAHLARMGSAEHAAYEIGRSASGGWKLRADGGGVEFAEAWDKAIDLWHARNPDRTRRGGRARGAWKPAPAPEPEPEPELDDEALWAEFQDGILAKYLFKLAAEREARLDGRIVEADFYVRQLTWLEVVLDLGDMADRTIALLKGLKRGDRHAGEIVATPISLLLDQLRRAWWEEEGGPERPPLAPLGRHDEAAATGQPLECQRWPERDGDGVNPGEQHEAYLRRNAEAQQAWEEKARADAEAWASREGRNSSPGFPGEGDRAEHGGGDSASARDPGADDR